MNPSTENRASINKTRKIAVWLPYRMRNPSMLPRFDDSAPASIDSKSIDSTTCTSKSFASSSCCLAFFFFFFFGFVDASAFAAPASEVCSLWCPRAIAAGGQALTVPTGVADWRSRRKARIVRHGTVPTRRVFGTKFSDRQLCLHRQSALRALSVCAAVALVACTAVRVPS